LEEVQAALTLGNREAAYDLYRAWIAANPQAPLLHAVCFNLGTLCLEDRRFADAIAAFEKAIEHDPDFPPSYINLGNAHERNGDLKAAIEVWLRAANLVPALTGPALGYKIAALKQVARVFETARLEADAEDVLVRSLDLDPRQRDVIQHWIALRQAQCKWPAVEPVAGLDLRDAWSAISPLSLAVECDDPIFQLANAYNYYWQDIAHRCSVQPHTEPLSLSRTGPLRVGYLSSDLREHAVGFLMSEVFELHDRRNVEVYAYYCGVKTSDLVQARFRASCDHWLDVSCFSDDDIATRIREDKIGILIDLNGYTKDARLKVVAARPAPVIVNWLGFPGTMGSPHHNYIIADPVIIPEGAERFYSERVFRLRCYQPNDRNRTVNPVRPTRGQAGLPKDGFVFCCFNSSQKFKPDVFSDWMEILDQTPGSVLWLLSGQSRTDEKLRSLACEAGVAPGRLIFAPRMPNAEHLARFALADLFLDTFPYGAHTTASDALWMGVPVLTRIGSSFAARVCASLVAAVGLPDFISQTREQYIAKAVRLANDPSAHAEARQRLLRNRDGCVLFDTPALVRDLEQLYAGMRDDALRNELPLPELSNVDSLLQVAVGLDRSKGDTPLDELIAQYRTALAYRGCRAASLELFSPETAGLHRRNAVADRDPARPVEPSYSI
jgi:predicted O-linked N-acetylglucosamine transferase (SPINDLY family)